MLKHSQIWISGSAKKKNSILAIWLILTANSKLVNTKCAEMFIRMHEKLSHLSLHRTHETQCFHNTDYEINHRGLCSCHVRTFYQHEPTRPLYQPHFLPKLNDPSLSRARIHFAVSEK